jgi:hypothetical protein
MPIPSEVHRPAALGAERRKRFPNPRPLASAADGQYGTAAGWHSAFHDLLDQTRADGPFMTELYPTEGSGQTLPRCRQKSKPCREVLVMALLPAVLERYAHDLVAGRRAVLRALQGHERAAPCIPAGTDHPRGVEQRGMRGEQLVGVIVALDPGSGLLSILDSGPAVEPALLDADPIVGRQVVAEPAYECCCDGNGAR